MVEFLCEKSSRKKKKKKRRQQQMSDDAVTLHDDNDVCVLLLLLSWCLSSLSSTCVHLLYAQISFVSPNILLTSQLGITRSDHHHHNRFTALFWDYPGESVPEENFWTLCCKGRLTDADTPTIRLGATPSGPTSALPPPSPLQCFDTVGWAARRASGL